MPQAWPPGDGAVTGTEDTSKTDGRQRRLTFDVAYAPIVVGKTMFVGSSYCDCLRAYDTETGAEVWRFFTEGPIRFAPVGHRGKIYAASDDGHLYCLQAKTGELLWKVRGGPNDQRVIGNERLVSAWPIRGGPICVTLLI